MPTFEVELRNQDAGAAPDGALEVRLLFPPLRTRFGKASIPDRLGGVIDSYAPTGVLVWIAWERRLDAKPATLTLEYVGEPPIEPEQRFSSDSLEDEVAVRVASLPRDVATPGLVRDDIIRGRHQLIDDQSEARFRELVEKRRIEIEATGDSTRRAQQRFFFDYDTKTHPDALFRDPARKAEIESAVGVLACRLIGRLPLQNAQTPAVEELPGGILERLSGLQLEIFRWHFPGSDAGIDLSGFDAAFVAFSVGRLVPAVRTTTYWNGLPNSANFFMFAEFAIHAIEKNESVEAWVKLLPTLVRCQELYTRVFAPYCKRNGVQREVARPRRTFGMYGGWCPTPDDIDVTIRALEDEYRLLGLDSSNLPGLIERHVLNARCAFPLGVTGSDDPCDAIDPS
jgi:hypothetical protein